MKGIKAHSHEQRSEILDRVALLMQKRFEDNLVAIAAEGSFARGEDKDFSDLEITVFLRRTPQNADWNIHKILDGLLLVIVFETKESFIEKYIENFEVWYACGSGDMLPLLNDKFVNEINALVPGNVEQKCKEQIQRRWPVFQEITAKLLNTIKVKDGEALSLIFPMMFKELLVLLSFANQTPYVTLGSYISQAKSFTFKPKGFDSLVLLATQGKYQDFLTLERVIIEVFSNLESYLKRKSLKLYIDSLDEL